MMNHKLVCKGHLRISRRSPVKTEGTGGEERLSKVIGGQGGTDIQKPLLGKRIRTVVGEKLEFPALE